MWNEKPVWVSLKQRRENLRRLTIVTRYITGEEAGNVASNGRERNYGDTITC